MATDQTVNWTHNGSPSCESKNGNTSEEYRVRSKTMASQSEIALVDTAEQPAASKPRKTRARRTAPPKRAKRVASRKTAKDTQPAGTDIVPVMKLRAIDIVDDAKPNKTRKRKSPAA
ncbi:MAG: hypothetical protein KAQ88_12810, partial [Hyphomicrobiaceae bacterium]|nr:hypothetical protein [Hyphomicrobiaceae bacterium]